MDPLLLSGFRGISAVLLSLAFQGFSKLERSRGPKILILVKGVAQAKMGGN